MKRKPNLVFDINILGFDLNWLIQSEHLDWALILQYLENLSVILLNHQMELKKKNPTAFCFILFLQNSVLFLTFSFSFLFLSFPSFLPLATPKAYGSQAKDKPAPSQRQLRIFNTLHHSTNSSSRVFSRLFSGGGGCRGRGVGHLKQN